MTARKGDTKPWKTIRRPNKTTIRLKDMLSPTRSYMATNG